MSSEFDKLINDFPLLYGGNFYFECNKGWEPLIRDLSGKLEELIKEYLKENPDGDCFCGCPKSAHNGACKTIYKLSYGQTFRVGYPPKTEDGWWRRFMWWFEWEIDSILHHILLNLGSFEMVYKKVICSCNGYDQFYPQVSQVKEKFGGLRFYMESATDEMYKLINEAERKSLSICEECGEPGFMRDTGWIHTLCDKCFEEYKNTRNKH